MLDRVEDYDWSDVKVRRCRWFYDQGTNQSSVQDPENRLSPEDEKKLLGIVRKNMPKVQLIGDRLVSKGLEDELRQKTKAFTSQKADAAWKRRSKSSPRDAVVTPLEVSVIRLRTECILI